MNKDEFITEMAYKATPLTDKERESILDDSILLSDQDTKIIVAIEELSELQKELCKRYKGEGDIFCILEEMADCILVLKQLQKIFNISEESLSIAMDVKLNREKERLEKRCEKFK